MNETDSRGYGPPHPQDWPMQAGPVMENLKSCEPTRRPRFDRERTKELLGLAETIAMLVGEKTQPGSERCRLRQMVEIFLEE